MTHAERLEIKPGTIVQYKRNGQVGARQGTFEFHMAARHGAAWCAIRDNHTGKLSRGKLYRVLSIVTPASAGAQVR